MIACLMAAPLAFLCHSLFWRLSGADIGQLRSLETGRRHSRGRHISGGGVADFFTCLTSVLHPPYGVYGVLICIGLHAILLLMVMKMGYSDAGEYDTDRNFIYSAKGTMAPPAG